MDRGTLKAFKIYTNFGHFLGFSPYKFVTIPSLQKNKEQHQPETSNDKLNNWLPNDDDDDEEESKDISLSFFSMVKKIRVWLYKKNVWRKNYGKKFIRTQDVELGDWKFVGGSRVESSWWLLLFSIGLQAIYQMFLIFRSIEAFLDEEQSPKEKVKIFYLSGILFILNFAQVLLVLNYGDHDIYLNAVKNTVIYIKNLEEQEYQNRFSFQRPETTQESERKRESKPKSRSIKVPIYAALALSIFVPLVRGSNVFRNPKSKLLITSLFSETPEKLPGWLKLFASAFHFHVAGFSVFVGIFLGASLVWYVTAVLPIIDHSRLQIAELRGRGNGNGKNRRRNESHVTAQFLYRSYNMLSVLQNNFKTVYGSVALLLEVITLYAVVLNIFLTVVHSNLPSLGRVIGIIYLQEILFSSLAEIHTASEAVIDSWTRNGSLLPQNSSWTFMWFKKFRESARPLRIYVGSFFYVDKTFMLTLMSITIAQTVNLMLLG